MTELTEKEQKYVDASYSELPWKLRFGLGNFDKCDECDEDMVSYRVNSNIRKDKMCFTCGAIQTPDTPTSTESTRSNSGKSQKQAKKDATKNTGKMLQMVGLLFCLTIVGAIIGIPLLIIGMKMEAPSED